MDADVSTRPWSQRYRWLLSWTGHAAVMALTAFSGYVVLAFGTMPFAFSSEHSVEDWLGYSIFAIYATAIFAAYPFVWWVTERRPPLGLLTIGAVAVAALVSIYGALTL